MGLRNEAKPAAKGEHVNGGGEAIAEPPAAEAPRPSAAELQAEIRSLVEVAGHVLRALRGVDADSVELPATISKKAVGRVNLDAAARAKAELTELRSVLQRYADGTDSVPAGDATVAKQVDWLRVLLEHVVGTSLSIRDDQGDDWPGEEEFEAARHEASSLVPGSADAPKTVWFVRNQTPAPITLRRRDGIPWTLPGYGERSLPENPHTVLDLRREVAAGEVDVDLRVTPGPTQYAALAALIWLVPGVIYVGYRWGMLFGIVAAACVLLLAMAFVVRQSLKQSDERLERLKAFIGNIPAWVAQSVTFLLILGAGIAVPVVATIFGADLRDEVRHVYDGDASSTEYLTVVGRSMQVALIAIASLLPALLYFQFDRDRLSTLREKFVHQIFRLDPTMTTQGAIKAKYGRLIEEIYGPEGKGRHRKLQPGRRAPVFVATLLIVLGWLFVLLNPDVGPITTEAELGSLLAPRQSPVAFAFLGAYFFTLFALLRGYVRRDLRPKSYSDISVRIIAVGILAWVLEVALPAADYLLVLAFLTGLVPQAALNKIREVYLEKGARGLVGGRAPKQGDDALDALEDRLPLTNLEGIDLYDRTRLASEGVTNIEALAHHDLIELMLQTRIPVPRLVDWTDQAMLHLHVNEKDRETLACYGIRTASDLLSACERAKCRGQLDSFFGILGDTKPGKPPRMQVIVDAMSDEEWISNLRFWHAGEDGVCLDDDVDPAAVTTTAGSTG